MLHVVALVVVLFQLGWLWNTFYPSQNHGAVFTPRGPWGEPGCPYTHLKGVRRGAWGDETCRQGHGLRAAGERARHQRGWEYVTS